MSVKKYSKRKKYIYIQTRTTTTEQVKYFRHKTTTAVKVRIVAQYKVLQTLQETSFAYLGEVNLCFRIRGKRALLVRTAHPIKTVLFI